MRLPSLTNLLTCLVLVLPFISGILHAQTAESIWSGVYTAAQAERGVESYRERCASCHGVDLRGDSHAVGLQGIGFMFIWEGRTLGELYEKMRNSMPADRPRSLTDETYADILAFILQFNKFPAGDTELGAKQEALGKLIISSR
jgi:S-disulfanyl-L-cysteine oxidoreductase SoxD